MNYEPRTFTPSRWLLTLMLVMLSSCALPAPERQQQRFVSDREIEVVSLAREGLSYVKRSRFLDAELKFRQALYLAPENRPIRLNLAITLDQQGVYDEAEQIYQKLLQEVPGSLRFRTGLAHVYLSQQRFDEASRVYAEAFEIAVEEKLSARAAAIARSLSVLALEEGKEEKALCWSLLAKREDKSPDQSFRHSRILLALGQADRALAEAELHTKDSNPDPRMLMIKAIVYFGKGQFEDAEEVVTRLLFRSNLPTSLTYELDLLRFLLTQLRLREFQKKQETQPDAAGPVLMVPELEDDPRAILDTEPLEARQSIYWPENFLDLLEKIGNEWQEEKERQGQGWKKFWFLAEDEPQEDPLRVFSVEMIEGGEL